MLYNMQRLGCIRRCTSYSNLSTRKKKAKLAKIQYYQIIVVDISSNVKSYHPASEILFFLRKWMCLFPENPNQSSTLRRGNR